MASESAKPDLAALQSRVAALANAGKSRAQRNRERAPEFAAWVDDYRRVFGPGVRVTFIQWPDGTCEGKRWTA